jgi:dCMP deaminase
MNCPRPVEFHSSAAGDHNGLSPSVKRRIFGGIMEPDEYYMNLAVASSARANCLRRAVGAVVVREGRVISTGYNGTPDRFTNCLDGGCVRCKGDYAAGTAYDLCICVHAEQNALLTAAREGIRTKRTRIYTTLQPCFSCLKEALQAGVEKVLYLDSLGGHSEESLAQQYKCLTEHLEAGVEQLPHAYGWPDTAVGAPGLSTAFGRE